MKRLLVYFFLSLTISTYAQTEDKRHKQFNLEGGAALQGYDPVSYFSGTPQKGKKGFSYTYQGIPYSFANAQNLETFKKTPEKYEPAYGGWCAYAMGASGEKVTIDPETFQIKDGKLYVFYHTFFNNTLEKWKQNETELNRKADANWKSIYK